MALEVGDMVLVHVTTFKGHHKIQNWWENREYVVERQPYPNVTVYVVCSRDREGHSQTLHRNYLLPISSILEQNEKDASMAGVEHTSTSAAVLSVDSEPADAEPSGMATSDTTGNTSQGSLDQPAPLRHGTCITQNQLPWRCQNFALPADTSLPHLCYAWVGLCICLHFISCMYTIFVGSIVWTHSTCSIPCLLGTTHFSVEGNSITVVSMVEFWMGEWTKGYLVWVQLPHQKNSKKVTPIETLGVCSSPTQETPRYSKNSKVTTQALVDSVSGVNTTAVCLLKDNKWLSFEQKDNKWLSFEQVRKKATLFESSDFLCGTQQASNTKMYRHIYIGDLTIFYI